MQTGEPQISNSPPPVFKQKAWENQEQEENNLQLPFPSFGTSAFQAWKQLSPWRASFPTALSKIAPRLLKPAPCSCPAARWLSRAPSPLVIFRVGIQPARPVSVWERPGAGTRLLRGSSGVLGAAPYQDKSILGCPEQPRIRASHFWGAQSSPRQGNISLGGPGVPATRETADSRHFWGAWSSPTQGTHLFWGARSSPVLHTSLLGCLEQPHTTHIGFGVLGATPCCTHQLWGAQSSPTTHTFFLGCLEQPHTMHINFGVPRAAPHPSISGYPGSCAPTEQPQHFLGGHRTPKHPLGGLDPCPRRHRPINSRSTRSPSLPINLINLRANEGLGVNEPSRQEAR